MATYFTEDEPDWNQFQEWTLELEEKTELCVHAQRFRQWRDEVCSKALASSNVILLNQTRLKVANRYYECYVSVSQEHKGCLGSRKHICIFSVFIETMQMLKEHELTIDPPLLFEPPTPAPPAPHQVVNIPGVVMGEFSDR